MRPRWRSIQLPDINIAILPPSTTRPNPLVAGDRVFASVFSPGAVVAVDRATGRLLWRTPLQQPFAGSAVHLAGDLLYAYTSSAILALHPDTGDVQWHYSPYPGRGGEQTYSQPAVFGKRLYFGDRGGYVHGLDSRTGKRLWRRAVHRVTGCKKCQVNAMVLATRDRVVASCICGVVACLDAASGQRIWRCDLEGNTVFEVVRMGRSALVAAKHLYRIDLATGAVRIAAASEPGQLFYAAATVANGRKIAAIIGPDFSDPKDLQRPWRFRMVIIERGQVVSQRATRSIGSLRPCACTANAFFVTTALRTLLLDATTPEPAVLASWKETFSLPDYADGMVYALSIEGVLRAIRLSSTRNSQSG